MIWLKYLKIKEIKGLRRQDFRRRNNLTIQKAYVGFPLLEFLWSRGPHNLIKIQKYLS